MRRATSRSSWWSTRRNTACSARTASANHPWLRQRRPLPTPSTTPLACGFRTCRLLARRCWPRSRAPAKGGPAMKSFELYEPTSVKDAVGMLDKFGATSKLLGGGSDLIGGVMKDWVTGKGMPIPVQVVDLTTIPDLKGINIGSDGIHIGATTTLSEIAEHADLGKSVPL